MSDHSEKRLLKSVKKRISLERKQEKKRNRQCRKKFIKNEIDILNSINYNYIYYDNEELF